MPLVAVVYHHSLLFATIHYGLHPVVLYKIALCKVHNEYSHGIHDIHPTLQNRRADFGLLPLVAGKIETVAFGARNQRKNDVMLQINILEEGISNLSKELKKLKSNIDCDISANKNVGFKKIDEKISVI